jgi:hypothetical protein
LVNFHFDFGVFLPVNSKKCDAGARHRPGREAPALGPEIDNWRSFGLGWREAPWQRSKLIPSVLEAPNDSRWIGRPNIFARL